MSPKSLWGDLTELPKAKSPIAYLREQANLLTAGVDSMLIGKVSTVQTFAGLQATLSVIAPALENYRYAVVRISHDPIKSYPLGLLDHTADAERTCENEEEFLQQLERVLSSEAVAKAISTLLSLSSE